MLLGVYRTRELLYKMNKAKSPYCFGCQSQTIETLNHLLLHCEYYQQVREAYLPKYIQENGQLSEILANEDLIIQTVLDVLVFLFHLSPQIICTIKITMVRWAEIRVLFGFNLTLTTSMKHEL